MTQFAAGKLLPGFATLCCESARALHNEAFVFCFAFRLVTLS
jgi:hypothetical protein